MALTAQQCDRAVGVLLATAAGDALGAGYEFTHPTADAVIDMIGGGVFGWEPGEWTDDTAMAVAVAEVAATGVDLGGAAGLDAVAAQFVRWFDSGPKDIGNQTRAVLSHRPAGAAAMQARARALTGRKGGNGALMRTAPVALSYLGSGDADAAVAAAGEVALLTHDDPQAVQACRLWTYAIRHAVLHGTFDGVRGYLQVCPADVAGYWAPLLDRAEHGTPGDFANNGWTVHACRPRGGRSAPPTIPTPGTCSVPSRPRSAPAVTPTPPPPSRADCSAPAGEPRRSPIGGGASCTAGPGTPRTT